MFYVRFKLTLALHLHNALLVAKERTAIPINTPALLNVFAWFIHRMLRVSMAVNAKSNLIQLHTYLRRHCHEFLDIYYCNSCIKISNLILMTIGTMHAYEQYNQYYISISLAMVYYALIAEYDANNICAGKLTITSGVKLQHKVVVSWSWKCSPMWQRNSYKIKDTLFNCMKVRWLGYFPCMANDRS